MIFKENYRILGLDNSRYCTGWGIVDVNDNDKKLIDYGYLDTKKIKDEGQTLVYLEKMFNAIIDQYKPDYIAAEQMFVGKNSQTAMVLSHIHGIMLLVAHKKNIPVVYYSVMTMKSCVLNGVKIKKEDGTRKTGDELKEEVAQEVLVTFGKSNFIKTYTNDVTDALSAILTFICKDGQPIEKKKKAKKKKNE